METTSTNGICQVMNLFGRNVPHYAFPKDCQDAYKVEKGSDIHASFSNNIGGLHLEKIDCDYAIVPMKAMRILYDGRYCAVSGFIFAIVDGKYSVLANKRGEGTPDYQGCWNCPCGFLERNEDSKTGIAREIRKSVTSTSTRRDLKSFTSKLSRSVATTETLRFVIVRSSVIRIRFLLLKSIIRQEKSTKCLTFAGFPSMTLTNMNGRFITTKRLLSTYLESLPGV